jgi:hypothetical protein
MRRERSALITARALEQTALFGVALLGVAATSRAEAAPCADLPNPVYVAGTGSKVIASLQTALFGGSTTIVYKLQGSCLAIGGVVNGTPMTSDMGLTGKYWDGTGLVDCDLDAAKVADLGLSDVFPTTCSGFPNGLPNTVSDTFGPVEEYSFVVPKASTQQSISREAAYFVFGFGNDSGVEPWTDSTELFVRDPDSGTQQMFGAAIGVPPTKWKGVSQASSGALATAVAMAPNPEAAIGVLTGEVYNAYRSTLDVLAYQDTDQTCGYWPDSTPTASDKVNVRDGHYAIWGPLHLITKLNASGYPVKPEAADIIGYLQGTKDAPGGLDLISFLAQSNLVPLCAMTVRRDTELGPLQSAAPQRACGCYFESVASGTNACTSCTSDIECPSELPKCNYGFCELQ